jgi:hypothetical protein
VKQDGDYGFYGSHGGTPYPAPIVGVAANGTDGNYWLVASDRNYFPYGDAAGSGAYRALAHLVVGIAAAACPTYHTAVTHRQG